LNNMPENLAAIEQTLIIKIYNDDGKINNRAT
jgi:hypothetical protein